MKFTLSLKHASAIKNIFAVLSILLLSGCGGSNKKEVAPVIGSVTLDGKPFTQLASVNFVPEGSGKMATGILKPDGTFTLKTYVEGDGAVIGKHSVSITPLTKFKKDDDTSPDPTSLIPERYRSSTNSGWLIEVKQGMAEPVHLEMKSK
jgi:hypothetical protein